ncbi:hypothetical protein NQZ68_018611 [Dissostichus eleginoides]|nr:hypothetical protein NQZ68_018611 [Dissostichus eleginoides]
MLCVVGCAPHADPMPSTLPGLRATCATLFHSSPPAPNTHTQALSLHLCLSERISDRRSRGLILWTRMEKHHSLEALLNPCGPPSNYATRSSSSDLSAN